MEFCNLKAQYNEYQSEIDMAIKKVIESSSFINGPDVKELEQNLTELKKHNWNNVADQIIEIFNKKALYILIREMTDTKTQHITKVVNVIKEDFSDKFKKFQEIQNSKKVQRIPKIPKKVDIYIKG